MSTDELVTYECRVHGPECYGCVFQVEIEHDCAECAGCAVEDCDQPRAIKGPVCIEHSIERTGGER